MEIPSIGLRKKCNDVMAHSNDVRRRNCYCGTSDAGRYLGIPDVSCEIGCLQSITMPFVKGKSGNPTGRPKEAPEVKAMARVHTAEAIERLVHWLRSDNPKASVAAALALLDRGYGRPEQAIEVSGEVTNYVARLPALSQATPAWQEQHTPPHLKQ